MDFEQSGFVHFVMISNAKINIKSSSIALGSATSHPAMTNGSEWGEKREKSKIFENLGIS